MLRMNRETMIDPSDRLIVVDRTKRRRTWIIAAVVIAVALVGAYFLFGRGDDAAAAAAGARAGASAAARSPASRSIVPGPDRRRAHRSPRRARSPRAATSRSASPAKAGACRTSMSTPEAGSARARCWRSIDRSVQGQEANQLAASIQVARADAALAQNELDRSQSLVGRGFVSKADLDRKRAARDAAQARVRVAQAQLGGAQARIGRLDIRAPSAGLILARNVEVGQVVSAGAGGAVPPRARRRDGNARLAVAAGPVAGPHRHGGVGQADRARPQLRRAACGRSRRSSTRRAARAKCGSRSPTIPSIRPGGFAEARIASGSTTAPLLPQSAVLSDEKGNYVYIVNAQERGRAARDQGRLDRRRGRDHRRRAERPGSRSCCRPARSSIPGRKVAPRRQAAR